MTLSILIPTYNYNARALVEGLRQCAEAEAVEAEIIIGDDASTCETAWLEAYEGEPSTDTPPSHSTPILVLRSPHNVGRAINRNRMADAAQGEWLLFVDCDAAVPAQPQAPHQPPVFSLRRYLQAAQTATVVCGGLRHPTINPCPEATLRFAYELEADRHRSAAERAQHPYRQLTFFNLLLRRDVFLAIRLDEQCRDYGYEDTLFGAELAKRKTPLLHIDNPLIHIGLESNDVFLQKTETALRTLHTLQGQMAGHSRLHNIALRVQLYHAAGIIVCLFRLTRHLLRRNLLSHHPSLRLFSLYKLGYYLSLYN